jgi:hypothetical protein
MPALSSEATCFNTIHGNARSRNSAPSIIDTQGTLSLNNTRKTVQSGNSGWAARIFDSATVPARRGHIYFPADKKYQHVH